MDNTIPQDTPQKQCGKCKEYFAATPAFFTRDRYKKDGLYTICKACCSARYIPKPPKPPKPCKISEGMKQCSKCPNSYPATTEFFQRDRAKKDGLSSSCKICRKQDHNKERQHEYNVRYYQQHKEAFHQYNRQYQAIHREEIAIKHRAYVIAHQETLSEKKKQYHKTDRGRAVSKAGNNKRRAVKKTVEGRITPQQIQEKLKAQKYRCYYAACGHAKFEKHKDGTYKYHLEHTIPLSRTEANPRHDMSYVVLSCPTCNLRKQNKLPHEFWEGGRLF